jgi:translation elongation factor EF-1alpha
MKTTLQEIYNLEQTQREKFINNSKFIGDTNTKMHTLILKLLYDCDELSLKSMYSLHKTTADHLEGSNEDLSHYFDAIQDICKKADNISNILKVDPQDFVELRQTQSNSNCTAVS